MPRCHERRKECMRREHVGGGCLGAFAGMFHWTRALQGSTKLLATPDLRTQLAGRLQKVEVGPDCTSGPLVKGKGTAPSKAPACTQPRDVVSPKSTMYLQLQQILDTKQEPFVLQDVIRDKRHPIRPNSRRSLTLKVNEEVTLSKRLKVSKKAKARVNRFLADDVENNHIGRCHLAEGMVAMAASNQAFPCNIQNARNACQCPSNVTSTRKNLLNSPSKRALLMEAASKILEGSNRKSKVPSRSGRVLLEELEGSRCTEELVVPRKTLLKQDVCQIQSIEDEGSVERLMYNEGENDYRANQRLLSSHYYDKTLPLVLWEGPAVATQCRALPHNSVLNESVALNRSVSVDAVQKVDTEQHGPNSDHPLRIKACVTESTAKAANKVEECNMEFPCMPHELVQAHRSEDAVLQIPEVIMGNVVVKKGGKFTELVEESDNTAPVAVCNTPSSPDVSDHVYCNPVDEALDIPKMSQQNDSARGALSAPTGRIPSSMHQGGLQELEQMRMQSENGEAMVEEQHSCDLVCDTVGLLDSRDEGANVGAFGVMSTPVPLFLCKNSWWMTEGVPANFSASDAEACKKKQQFLERSPGSPAAILVSSPLIVQNFEGKGLEDEEPSVFCDCSSMESECQQSSPVSVLDSIYEEGEPMLSSTFHYFDEARQKLLDCVRRFEMLAHSDLDFEAAGYSLDSSRMEDEMPSPDYLEFDHKCPSTCAVEGKAEGGLFLGSARDSQLRPIMDERWGVENQSQRSCKVFMGEKSKSYVLRIASNDSGDVAKHPNSALFCVDLALGPWKCFDEEVEEVQMALEGSLFGLLMQELLFDIMHQS